MCQFADGSVNRYSLFEHLARIARPTDWKAVQLAMFTAYFDASGHESDQPVVSVAGFVASAEAWRAFEEEWLKRLQQDGLSYFHRKELNGYQGEFAMGWKGNRPRIDRLVFDLIAIIQSNAARKFGAAVIPADLQKTFSKVERKKWNLMAYSLGGRTCAARVREWFQSWGASRLPEFVFEEGDAGAIELTKMFRESGLANPIFKPKRTYRDKHGMVREAAVPLQAADLLAYETFEPIRKIQRGIALTSIRPEFTELDKIPGELGIVTETTMGLLADYLRGWDATKEANRVIGIRSTKR